MDGEQKQYVVGYYGVGTELSKPIPGDVILTHGSDWPSKAIRFGQSFRFRGDKKVFAYFNHAAMVISEDGTIVEALTRGVVTSPLSKYTPKEYIVIRVKATSEDRNQMIRFVNHALGRKYGWTEIISLFLSLLTGLKFNFGVDDEVICSGLVASALERGYDIFERQCSFMTPADLAAHYNAVAPTKVIDVPQSLGSKIDYLAEHAATDILVAIVGSLLAVVIVLALASSHQSPYELQSGSSPYMDIVGHSATTHP